MAVKLGPGAVWGLLKEAKTALEDVRPLQVSGVLAPTLEKELARGGRPGAVRSDGDPAGAAALVRVLAGAATDEDEEELRAARRARVPTIAVQTGTGAFDVP